MQRLISMNAIQSYTSENGLKRNSESRADYQIEETWILWKILTKTYKKMKKNNRSSLILKKEGTEEEDYKLKSNAKAKLPEQEKIQL